jgi:hypothetical protein
MSPEVRHPRALAAFRVLLLGVGAAVGGTVLAATLGYLLLVGVVGAVLAALTGEAVLGAMVVLLAVGLLCSGLVVGGTAYLLQRVERHVTRADMVPTAVERAHRRYLDDETDEGGLERDLDRALSGERGRVRLSPDRADDGEREVA